MLGLPATQSRPRRGNSRKTWPLCTSLSLIEDQGDSPNPAPSVPQGLISQVG